MHRRRILILAAVACVASTARAAPKLTNFRFGTLRIVSDGVFDFVSETRRIPRRWKDTGFRFGIGFDNPMREPIEWYEIMHLPESTKEVSGNFQRARTQSLRTKTFNSDQPSVVDEFWFDEGDPLGKHRLELFVNGSLTYTVHFEVVNDK